MNNRLKNPRHPHRLPLVAALAMAVAHAPATIGAESHEQSAPPEYRQPHYGNGLVAKFGIPRERAKALDAPTRTHTIRVSNCADNGAGSLRATVASAQSGDVVDLSHLHCGLITLTSGAISIAVDDLTLRGPQPIPLVIDGHRHDRVVNHVGAGTVTIDSLILTRGRYEALSGNSYGGCVFSAGSVELDHAGLLDCEVGSSQGSAYGGGMFAYYNALVSSSIVAGNKVRASLHAVGGGVATYAGGGIVRGSLISGNTTEATSVEPRGPGYSIDASVGGIGGLAFLDITDSIISGNSVTARSAAPMNFAIANEAGVITFGSLTLTRSTISNNSARAFQTGADASTYGYAASLGGALRGADVTITDSTISGNSVFASADNPAGYAYSCALGGGLSGFGPYDSLVVTNSTISGNSAHREGGPTTYCYSAGGGGRIRGYSLDIANSTIAFNSADSAGGLSFKGPYALTLNSTVVAKNVQQSGGDMVGLITVTVEGANNFVGSGDPTMILPGDTLFGDPRLGALAYNGGTTRTHLPRSGSPLVDAGNNLSGLPFDQRGPGFPRRAGSATDIGAVEGNRR